jgi:hypothetical protein
MFFNIDVKHGVFFINITKQMLDRLEAAANGRRYQQQTWHSHDTMMI